MQFRRITSSFKQLAIAISLCVLAGCVTHSAPKSDAEVPDAVRQAFAQKFPAVQSAEWKRKSDQNYEAEFTASGTEIAAKFSPAGEWLETESGIPTSQVPQAVNESVAAAFKDYQVIETQSIEREGDSRLCYELHLRNDRQTVKALFAGDGTILSRSSKPKP